MTKEPSTRRGRVTTTRATDATEDSALLQRRDASFIDADPWRVLRILSEFVEGFDALAAIPPAVSVFGSARINAGDPSYATARAVGAELAKAGFAVITGGGPGVMEAANRGCREAGGLSVGFGIELPHEQRMNDYIDLGLVFDHFYARKTMFVKAAEGFCVFPGGFGTADELFESLVLIQTGKVMHFPVVLMGEGYWTPLLEWVRCSALADGMVSPEALALLTLTDDPQIAVETVLDAFQAG